MPLLTTRAGASSGAYGFGAAAGGVDAYTLLDSITVSSNVSSVTFSSINQNYEHLMLEGILYTQSSSSATPYLTMNGATSGYRYAKVYQENSSNPGKASSGSGGLTYISFWQAQQWNASTVAGCQMLFVDYANTTRYKNVIYQIGGYTTSTNVNHTHGWGSIDATSAISSITITGSFATGTKLNLFGIVGAV